MKSTIITVICAVFVLAGCKTSDAAKASNAETMQELAKVEKHDNYICKTVRKTGSNFNTRRCMTKESYEKTKEQSKKALRSLDRNWTRHSDG